MWLRETRATRLCNTLLWFPTKTTMPPASSTDLILAGIQDIVQAIQVPFPGLPLAPLTDSRHAALRQLTKVLTSLAGAAPHNMFPAAPRSSRPRGDASEGGAGGPYPPNGGPTTEGGYSPTLPRSLVPPLPRAAPAASRSLCVVALRHLRCNVSQQQQCTRPTPPLCPMHCSHNAQAARRC